MRDLRCDTLDSMGRAHSIRVDVSPCFFVSSLAIAFSLYVDLCAAMMKPIVDTMLLLAMIMAVVMVVCS